MLDNNYKRELEKAYLAKKEDDIITVGNFCQLYDEKLGTQEIEDLLKLFNGQASTNEQNEFIVNMLDTIVKKEKQKAVNEIIVHSDILAREKATKCISLIVTMIVFWNRNLNINLSTALDNTSDSIKGLYKKVLEKRLKSVNDTDSQLIEEILKRI